jgi:hypothetical protein
LFSAKAHEVIDRNLDQAWLDRFPTLSPTFQRYGLKGGNLATGAGNQILTWAHYMQTSAGRFVVVVFLRDMLDNRRPPDTADVNAFAQQFALSAGFRQQVRDALEGADSPPELVPQLTKVKASGQTVTVKAQIWNSSPATSGGPFTVSLYVLDEAETQGAVPIDSVEVSSLGGFKSKKITLKATAEADGKLAVVLVDADQAVTEQDEDNNLTWERLD